MAPKRRVASRKGPHDITLSQRPHGIKLKVRESTCHHTEAATPRRNGRIQTRARPRWIAPQRLARRTRGDCASSQWYVCCTPCCSALYVARHVVARTAGQQWRVVHSEAILEQPVVRHVHRDRPPREPAHRRQPPKVQLDRTESRERAQVVQMRRRGRECRAHRRFRRRVVIVGGARSAIAALIALLVRFPVRRLCCGAPVRERAERDAPHVAATAASALLAHFPFVPAVAEWLHTIRAASIMDTTRARMFLGWTPAFTTWQALDALARTKNGLRQP